jgi:hypothetical protein
MGTLSRSSRARPAAPSKIARLAGDAVPFVPFAGVVLAVGVAACGGAPRPVVAVPIRVPTAGDAALALLPPGPDVVLELDLARARANPLVGPVVDGWLGAAGAALGDGALGDAPRPPLAGAAWVVLAGYRVGTAEASTITLLAPGPGSEVPGAVEVDPGVVALAPPADVERVRAAIAGGPTAGADRALLALRARAMPAAADGAVIRLTARLSADARIALAGALGIEPAPRAVSAWADVADDAALIVDLDGRDPTDPVATRRLRTALTRLIQRAAADPGVTALGLAPVVARTRITASKSGAWLRAVLVIAPARLRWAVAQAQPAAAPEKATAP